MSLPIILEKYRSEVDNEIKSVINSRSAPLYDMMRYHFGWIDKNGRTANHNSGKALRPALCLFSCEAVGGDYHQVLPAAAALELVHNFSLIHDDIQDNDRERHHRPTVWAIWGQPQAINAGTAMRILANTALRRLDIKHIPLEKRFHVHELLDEISLRLIEGQYLDIQFEDRFDIKVVDYLTMIQGKTAALISGSMEIGAFLGTEDESLIRSFREIGHNLGLAFQIRDDILGIWGDAQETGKSSDNDIRRRKKSFPVVFALEHIQNSQREELISIYQKSSLDEKAVKQVLNIFDSIDTRNNAQKTVDQYSALAIRTFQSLPVSSSAKEEMKNLIQFLTGRTF